MRTTERGGGKDMIFSFAILVSMDGDLTTAPASGLRNWNFHVTSRLQAVYDLNDRRHMFPDSRQFVVINTAIAIFLPDRFCWYRRFWSVVIIASKSSDSASFINSPLQMLFSPFSYASSAR